MSALERGGTSRSGARSKELYDAFGEVSDDEADEDAALVGGRPEGFHSSFLRDDDEEGAEKPYRDHPEDSGERIKPGFGQPSPPHQGSEGESSVSGSWVDAERIP
jgi:kexin